MRACALPTTVARDARGRVSGPGPASRIEKEVRAPANALGLNDNTGNASRSGPR